MKIRNYVAGVVILSSCGYGPTTTNCGDQDPSPVLDRIREVLHLDEVIDRLDIICTDDTRVSCRNDVDACTPRLGSAVERGRVIVSNDVPLGAALAHESLHWLTWDDGGCYSHSESCWDAELVEHLADTE